MKKLVWGLVGVALAASVVAASAQEVLSANTIGYIKRELPAAGKLITVAVPLYNMTAAQNVFSNLSIASEVPPLSVASFWDTGSQTWQSGQKSSKGVWPLNVVTQVIDSGEFFFIQGPLTSTEPSEITIAGEVPADSTLVRSLSGTGNLSALASAYPADFVFGPSSLASNATPLSVASFWDVPSQTWQSGQKSSKGVWPLNVVTQKVLATAGFFIQEAGSVTTWTNAKPYTWP